MTPGDVGARMPSGVSTCPAWRARSPHLDASGAERAHTAPSLYPCELICVTHSKGLRLNSTQAAGSDGISLP